VAPVIVIKSSFHENKVQISFTDNGKGIDLKNHGKQLFRLYKRFDTTVEGKGLGLFMVKTQVESLGGTISVNSEIDKGTQFIIQLPL
jgi:signal transduction histidine kinase